LCRFAVIERRDFLRECIVRSLSSCSTLAVDSFASVEDLLKCSKTVEASLLILSVVRLSEHEAKRELIALFEAMPHIPTIVLAHEGDVDGALEAIGSGARGYIPASLGFEIAIEAMRFVNAGGTYVPAECLLASRASQAQHPKPASIGAGATAPITTRELAVVQALRQGKPNKIIAFELNMCESTVKVHVRHLMKKLRAKNRTEVAMKAGEIMQAAGCSFETRCGVSSSCDYTATRIAAAAPSD
jgi:DNA-binding NarL/FixJ family response regulator